jgi:hypothetical protein
MATDKRILGFDELEAHTLFALPDRELMHVHKAGSHHLGSHHASSATSTTTTIVCGSQSISHVNNARLQFVPIRIRINAPVGSCNTLSGKR